MTDRQDTLAAANRNRGISLDLLEQLKPIIEQLTDPIDCETMKLALTELISEYM